MPKTNANDNKKMLYRIRRKADGRYLDSKPSQSPGACYYFGPHGIFWQSEEKVKEHLKELIAFRVYVYDQPADKYTLRHVSRIKSKKIRDSYGEALYCDPSTYSTPQRFVRYVDEWLDKYEVVATPATIHYTESQTLDPEIFMNDKEACRMTAESIPEDQAEAHNAPEHFNDSLVDKIEKKRAEDG